MRVPAIGPWDAKIIALGESPGAQEMKAGIPFVGPAGQSLNDLLQAVGIKRDELFITNTVKVLPPAGDKEKAAFFFNKGVPTNAYMEGIVELVSEINTI